MFCSRTALRPEADGTFDWHDATVEPTEYTSKSEKHPTSATAGTKEGSVPSGAIKAPNDNHPGVTIDHSAFPHIFENIYNNTEGPRTHFRGVVSYFHRKIDKENLWHLALASSGDSKGIALLGGENKGSLSVRDAFNTSWGFNKSYWFYVDQSSASPVLHRAPMRSLNLAVNTMTVDIVGCPPLPYFKSTIVDGAKLAQVPVVRAIPTPSSWGVQEESLQMSTGMEPSVNRVSDIVKAHILVLFTRPRGPLLSFRPKHPSGFLERFLVVNIGPPVDVDPSANWHGGSSGAASNNVFRMPKEDHMELPVCAPPSDIPKRVTHRFYIFDKAWTKWQLDSCGGGALGFIVESIAQHILQVFDERTMPSKPKWVLVGVELLSGAVIGTHDPISGLPLSRYLDANRLSILRPLWTGHSNLSPQQSRQYAENKFHIVAAVVAMVMHCGDDNRPQDERRAETLIRRVVEFRTMEEHEADRRETFPSLWELETVGYPWHTQTKEQMMANP